MSAPLLSIVEGWNGALPFTLNADGAGIDLTGLTVAIVLRNAAGDLERGSLPGGEQSVSRPLSCDRCAGEECVFPE
jgi:hypothetical protein